MYYQAQRLAKTSRWGVVAGIKRGKQWHLSVCEDKTHPACQGYRGELKHAEHGLINRSRPGEVVHLWRFNRMGDPTPINPCARCARLLEERQLKWLAMT